MQVPACHSLMAKIEKYYFISGFLTKRQKSSKEHPHLLTRFSGSKRVIFIKSLQIFIVKRRLGCAGGHLLFDDGVKSKAVWAAGEFFWFSHRKLAGRWAISAGIFASFVARQKKALAAAKDWISIRSLAFLFLLHQGKRKIKKTTKSI